MGQSLTGTEVQSTYEGLLKTSSNAPLATSSLEPVSDGAGNDSALELAQEQARLKGEYVEVCNSTQTSGILVDEAQGDKVLYYGNQDFQFANVTGLPDDNTTYTISAAQDGTNVDLNLNGSDATVDTVTLVAGTNVTLTQSGDNITIDAAGGGGGSDQEMYPIQLPKFQGYGPLFGNYFTMSQPIIGQATFQNAVDFNTNRPMLGALYLEPGKSIPYMWFRVLNITGNTTYEYAIYDAWPNGAPKDRKYVSSFSVTAAEGPAVWKFSGINTFIPTTSVHWVAIKPISGEGNSTIGVVSRDRYATRMVSTYGNPANIVGIGQLQVNSSGFFPTSWLEDQEWSHRDEGFLVGLSNYP